MPGNKSRLPNLDNSMLTQITRVQANTSGENNYEKGKYATPTVRSAQRGIMKSSAKTNAEMMRRIKKEEYNEKEGIPKFKGFLVKVVTTIPYLVACEVTNADVLIALYSKAELNETYTNRLYKINPEGTYSLFTSDPISANRTTDIALNVNTNEIYVADPSTNKIHKFSQDGITKTTLSASYSPSRIAVDNATGDLYVVDETNNFLMKYDQGSGSAIQVASIDANATGIVVNDAIYISYPTKITKVTKAGIVSTLASDFNNLKDISIDKDGKVYVTEETLRTIIAVNFITGEKTEYDYFVSSDVTKIPVQLTNITGISAMRNNSLLFYVLEPNQPRVLRLELTK